MWYHGNLTPRHVDTVHHPPWCGNSATYLKPCHMPISIILDVCILSHLDRCRYVSFRGLIVGCSIFEKIDSSRVSFLPVVMLVGVLGARQRDNDGDRINNLMRCNLDHEDCVKPCFPFVFSPHVLNLGTRFLYSGGELSHP